MSIGSINTGPPVQAPWRPISDDMPTDKDTFIFVWVICESGHQLPSVFRADIFARSARPDMPAHLRTLGTAWMPLMDGPQGQKAGEIAR